MSRSTDFGMKLFLSAQRSNGLWKPVGFLGRPSLPCFVYDADGICPVLVASVWKDPIKIAIDETSSQTTSEKGGNPMEGENGKKLTIRKLTERECLRLMAYRDEEIDRLFAAVDEKGKRLFPKTALYRFAGNSIVVDCLTEVFDAALFPEEEGPKGLERWI